MKSLLLITLMAISFAAHADEASDKEREAIIASNPDLAAVMSDKKACKDANALDLSNKYISRGATLDKDQDVAGSRVWRFSNLENDLALSTKDKHPDPSTECLDALASAGIKEQIKFWKIRKSTDCNEASDKAICEKAESELKWASGESARLKATVKGMIKRVADLVKKPTSQLEACPTCATQSPLLTAIKDVADKTTAASRAAECCSIFKKRDGEMSEAKCEELHSGKKSFTDSVASDCFAHIAKGFITGIMSQIKGLFWDLPKSIFDGSFLAGAGTLIHELTSDPGKGIELLLSSLGRSMGIEPAYSACLDESQRAKYRCDVGGNMLSQVAMLAGGWAKVFQTISKVSKVAEGLTGLKKAADATRAASDLAKGAAKVAKDAAVEVPVATAARTAEEMELAAGKLKSTEIKASDVSIENPQIAQLTRSIDKLKGERGQLAKELQNAKLSDQPKMRVEIEKIDQHIAMAEDSIPRLIVADTSAAVKVPKVTDTLKAEKPVVKGSPTLEKEHQDLSEALKTAKHQAEKDKIQKELVKVESEIARNTEMQAKFVAKTEAAKELPTFLKQKMTDYSDFVKQSLELRKSIKEVKETVKSATKEEIAITKELKKAKKASDPEATTALKEKEFEAKVKVLKQKFLQEKLEEARVTHIKFLRTWIGKNKRIAPAAVLAAAEASLHAEEVAHEKSTEPAGPASASEPPDDGSTGAPAPAAVKAPVNAAKPSAAARPTQDTNVGEDSD